MKCTYCRVKCGFCPSGKSFWYKHCYAPKYRPYVKVGNPPGGKSPNKAIKKNKNINGNKGFKSKQNGGKHYKQSKQVDVWKNRHNFF